MTTAIDCGHILLFGSSPTFLRCFIKYFRVKYQTGGNFSQSTFLKYIGLEHRNRFLNLTNNLVNGMDSSLVFWATHLSSSSLRFESIRGSGNSLKKRTKVLVSKVTSFVSKTWYFRWSSSSLESVFGIGVSDRFCNIFSNIFQLFKHSVIVG